MRAAAGRLAVLSLQYSIASARAAPQRLNPQGIGTRLMATKFSEITAAEMRSAMIDSQLRTNDVIDPAVIGAMAAVPREANVPSALAGVAYTDRATALGHGRPPTAPLVTGPLRVDRQRDGWGQG